jgi:predicted short-subunit dehydrogenase-like oxidoreductase (DUF2520 family)
MQKPLHNNILLVGTGGLALSLVSALVKSKNYTIFSQGSNEENTNAFCRKFKIKPFKELENKKDLIVLLAVPDSQIEVCAVKYANFSNLMVHFSGTTTIETLSKLVKNAAVCWPIGSFSKSKKVNFSKIVCTLSASNKYSENILLNIIESIPSKYIFLNNEERMKLHLTAVVLNNFIYHLLTLTKEWTTKENIDNSLFNSLLKATTASFYENDNGEKQTGPAKRKDKIILNKHLKLLEKYPELQNIYSVFTASILKKYTI